MVTVPPRMGWTKNNAHHDTIRFSQLGGMTMRIECVKNIIHDILKDELDYLQGSPPFGVSEW